MPRAAVGPNGRNARFILIKETEEIHRLRSDELTKNYRVNRVDSRDILQILDCFDLECELK